MRVVADFRTNRGDTEFVTKTVFASYVKMLEFCLGKKVMGDQLKYPSGRLASALSFRVRSLPSGGSSILIKFDEGIAPEVKNVLDGSNYSLKQSLLKNAKKWSPKVGRYRVIPLKKENPALSKGALLSDPALSGLFDRSKSGQSSVWNPLTTYLANVFNSNNLPGKDFTDIRPEDKNHSIEMNRMFMEKEFRTQILNSPVEGKFGVKFRTVSDRTPSNKWVMKRKPYSVIQNLVENLKKNLRGVDVQRPNT